MVLFMKVSCYLCPPPNEPPPDRVLLEEPIEREPLEPIERQPNEPEPLGELLRVDGV